ncbi:peptidyl-prolyl cis-trans isomerase C [Christiangramia gaetbulicola]|uniref:peptidylprolyl isomerase n=1 Tax=Christiangramia gaetbulicola TaxID=703340 RepID=A0A2T6AM12_9FLAO|nr:peptidylprolyl isomerase [Christiangramia gaetbulicola]PTX44859.1 peptidyl-prolyl cis-trans isomerase C [Christiangramia gaetbulicola]
MLSILKKPIARIILFGLSLAAILLIIYGPKQPGLEDKKVLVGNADVAQLIASWNRTWNRMPTEEELSGMLENYVREEILYREALNQDMDENNSMIRRGLIVQMNMLAESQAQEKKISEEAIRAYYDLRKDQFTRSPIYSFTQLNFDGGIASEEIEKIREKLNADKLTPTAKDLPGNKGMLPRNFEKAGADEIIRTLGENFIQPLEELELNTWEGPVRSGFGWHLVYITEKLPAEPLPLETVKDAIITELQYEEARAAKEQFYTELRQQYDVVYEGIAKDLLND